MNALSTLNFFMAIFLCNISNAQVIKHDLLGLNMDLDWYTLTNYSVISYVVGKSDTNSSWVVADCDYHLKSVDIELESLMFTDIKHLFLPLPVLFYALNSIRCRSFCVPFAAVVHKQIFLFLRTS